MLFVLHAVLMVFLLPAAAAAVGIPLVMACYLALVYVHPQFGMRNGAPLSPELLVVGQGFATDGMRGGLPVLLLVDDNATFCQVTSRALAARGFDVRVAHTMDAAWTLANATTPEYAVVDLKIDDRNGLKLVSSLSALNPAMQIVVVTGYGSIATAIEAIKLGTRYYLCKPVDADEIVASFRHDGDADATFGEKPMSLKRLEWEHIARVLEEHGGSISKAARALSMHRRTRYSASSPSAPHATESGPYGARLTARART